MSGLDVCRICLAANVTMHHIRNTRIQAIFEKLTSKKLTENGRPETICFLCYSQLQKCRKVLDLYQKTDNVFAQLANGGIEITENTLYFVKRSNIVNRLVTPLTHIDVIPVTGMSKVTVENINEVVVKEEPKDEAIELKIERIEHDEVSEAFCEDFIKSEEEDYTEDSILQKKSTKNHSKSKRSRPLNSELVQLKSYICDLCNKTFYSRRNIKLHIRWHGREKLFSCDECKQTFTFKTNLIKHYQSFHKRSEFPCDICGKAFKRSDYLQRHKKIHFGKKPYPCKICNMTFTTPSNVQQHINSTHRTEKPFVCDVCGRLFNRKGNLKAHYRVHTGEKPFKCTKCDFQCSHKTNLTKHVEKACGKTAF